MTTLTDFLLERIAEDEAAAQAASEEGAYPHYGDSAAEECVEMAQQEGCAPEGYRYLRRWMPARVLAECAAKRQIVEMHKAWPVLVETQPEFSSASGDDADSVTLRMSKQIAWTTEQEYRDRFGDEPPTGAILRVLAAIYADHPDYRAEWDL